MDPAVTVVGAVVVAVARYLAASKLGGKALEQVGEAGGDAVVGVGKAAYERLKALLGRGDPAERKAAKALADVQADPDDEDYRAKLAKELVALAAVNEELLRALEELGGSLRGGDRPDIRGEVNIAGQASVTGPVIGVVDRGSTVIYNEPPPPPPAPEPRAAAASSGGITANIGSVGAGSQVAVGTGITQMGGAGGATGAAPAARPGGPASGEATMTEGPVSGPSDATASAIRVLVVLSQAADQVHLDLLQEWKVLRECLAPYGGRFTLEPLPAATVDDLSRALARFEPHILHFSGHGAEMGLLFEDERAGTRLVPRDALVRELALHAPPLRCVILNACHSDVHAKGVRLGVPYVVTMRGEIGDAAAIEFTRGFYDALAARPDDVRRAFALGCSRIALKGLPDVDLPALHEGG